MQGIQTDSIRLAKEQRRRRIGGIIIIALLLLSTAGFALSGVGITRDNSGKDTGPTYNGQYWVYNAGGQQYYFTNAASELDFAIAGGLTKSIIDFSGKSVYIDSDSPTVLQEISQNLGRHVSRLSEACYGDCVRDLPEKSCANDLMIVARASETPSIREEGKCIFIEGDLKSIDIFLYRALGLS